MNLRRAARSAVLVLSTVAAAAVPMIGSPTASAAVGTETHTATSGAPATSVAATAPWSFIRRACRTFAAGTVCVNVEGNGQPNTYRIVYQLQPKPGQWMRPLSTAAWRSGGQVGVGAFTAYRPFCATACAAVRTATNYVVASSIFGVYTMIADTPSGHVDVSAGVTPVYGEAALGYCGSSATAISFLTSTSDGTVYLARSGSSSGFQDRFVLADYSPVTKTSHVFFTRRGDETTIDYGSPTFYTSWLRQPYQGGWVTQETFSIADGRHSYDGDGRC